MTSKVAIQSAQLDQMVEVSMGAIIVGAVLALVLTYTLSLERGNAALFGWCAAVLAVSAARTWHGLSLRRSRRWLEAALRPTLSRFRMGVMTTGLLWGAASLFAFPEGNHAAQMLMIFIVAGITAGGMLTYAADLACGALFLLAALLPLIARLFHEGGPFLSAMGVAGSIYLVFMLTSLRLLHQKLYDNIVLRLQAAEEEEEKQLAAMVFGNASEGMLVTDQNNRIITVNPAFTALTGYSLQEVKGRNPSMFKSGLHGQEFYRQMWRSLSNSGSWQGEIWDKRKDGELLAKRLSINTIRDAAGAVHRHVALFSDITERKRAEELIWRQANFDGLTRLPNRQMFQDRLAQEARKSQRTGKSLALLLVDLDHFKEVNDTLGHAVGDELLVEAAQRIGACVRETDTIARLGGDEFAIILPELEEPARIERIAQDIIARLAPAFRLGAEEAYISASIGISLYPLDSDNLDALFKHADQAMYAAKRSGRNRFNYFTRDMQAAAQKRLRLTSDMHLALEQGQFQVYYQPIIELGSGRIHKAEALLRWNHPQRGMVSPADFIPLAEETGMIVPIGDWMFQEVVSQVLAWRSAYSPEFQISVNKSPVQVHNNSHGHINWVDYLHSRAVPGSAINIELTEGMLIDADPLVQKKLLDFSAAGIQVSIDDFGTGYSSLAYLKRFDVDYLKIDQSFVRNLEHDPSDQALCEAICVMAHKLGMKVVAEGVETEAQRGMLQLFGCDYGQGYLFSRAKPAHEFESMLKPPPAAHYAGGAHDAAAPLQQPAP